MGKEQVTGNIIIDQELCKGCYLCISVCPQNVIAVSKNINRQGYYPVIFKGTNEEGKGCIACVRCATICPDIAIEVYRD
ncbi:MAG: 4Fe-4S binding protein [Deltaproteobacteria bacterium]|nr:4Fe-4S binding protein [Deltaproteobacteria bacterium]